MHNRSLWTGSVALALSVTPSLATAQDNQDGPPSADGEIIVVGTRASLESGIKRKRAAGTVVDSVVAEDVSQFPDKNIGEALQRVTGVQLQREFGEGVAVSIRGVEPDLNRVEINGVSLLGNGGAGERGVDFRELASELVKSIDVFKGFTADMTEGGVGGTVSIQTRKPLDLTKPLLAGTLSGQYLDGADKKVRPRANLTAGKKFLDDRFGILVNLTYDHNLTRGDFLRNTEWVRLADFNGDNRNLVPHPIYGSIPTVAGCRQVPQGPDMRAACQRQFYDNSPRTPRYGIWTRNDERVSAMATLQYEFSDNLRAFVEGQYNRRRNRLIDYNYSVDLKSTDRIDASSVVIDKDNNVIDLVTAPTATGDAAGAGSIFGTSKRDFIYRQSSRYLSGGFDWTSERLTVTGLAVTSKARTVSDSKVIALSASIPSIRVRLDPDTGIPRFTFPDGFDPQQAATYTSGIRPVGPSLQYRPDEVDTGETQFKLDADYAFDNGLLKSIEVGGQYRRSTSLRYSGGGYVTPDGTVVPGNDRTQTVIIRDGGNAPLIWTPEKLASFIAASSELTPGTFFDVDGIDRTGLPDAWLSPNFDAVADYFDLSGFNRDCLRLCNGMAQIPTHDISESIAAGYLKANLETTLFGLALTGNAGVRYVTTRTHATGSSIRRERVTDPATGVTSTVTVGTLPVTIRNRYSDILPSANANLELLRGLDLRLGYAKVLARPKPTDLVPNANCLYDLTADGIADESLDTCSAGNPSLKPYRADQYDLNLAWYANRDTLLNAALFYKDVKSFVLARTLVPGVDLFKDGTLYDVTQPINGAGAKILGVELSAQTAFTFLPAPFDGLGAIANYTYSKATDVGLSNTLDGSELGFPGLSKHSYNFVLYYDKGAINIRAAYNGRSRYLLAAAERSGNPVFRDGTNYLDAKITYRVPGTGISAFIEGKNLTEETERSTSGSIRMAETSYPGKRFFAGVSLRY
ncbi:TonB-dependent receptor [Sphingomonas zeicaulis]|uniref:TonB-dependent receptor n=1 Tax=Sphingomonas zeicaulis TaxID=1632740 RepID=UPI003D1D9285